MKKLLITLSAIAMLLMSAITANAAIKWENKTNKCYEYICSEDGKELMNKTLEAIDWESKTNICYTYECTIYGEEIKNKTSDAINWERKTNGCFEYKCTEDGEMKSLSICNGDGHVCIDGKCESSKSITKGWSVVIQLNNNSMNDVNANEIQNTLSVLCGIKSDDITIGIEYNEAGDVINIIVFVDDENDAQNIWTKIEESSQSSKCDIGVLCTSKLVEIKNLDIEFSGSQYNYNIGNMFINVILILIMFITLI